MSEKIKHGRPWDVNGRFETFEEANNRRDIILSKDDNQCDVKVRRLSIGDGNHAFFVKTRVKEEFLSKEKNDKKRVRRKTKGSKKQKSL